MSEPARRDLFKVAGAGVVAVGAVALTPRDAEALPSSAAFPGSARRREILAHVKDPRTGRITVMIEGDEVEIVDREIVARLLRAVAGRD